MKRVTVWYQYFDDSICGRCVDTERELRAAIGAFTSRCRNVSISLIKQELSPDEIEKSPTVLVDGVDIEAIMTNSSTPKTSACGECSCVVKKELSCRSYGTDNTLSQSEILLALSTHLCDRNKYYAYPCVC